MKRTLLLAASAALLAAPSLAMASPLMSEAYVSPSPTVHLVTQDVGIDIAITAYDGADGLYSGADSQEAVTDDDENAAIEAVPVSDGLTYQIATLERYDVDPANLFMHEISDVMSDRSAPDISVQIVAEKALSAHVKDANQLSDFMDESRIATHIAMTGISYQVADLPDASDNPFNDAAFLSAFG